MSIVDDNGRPGTVLPDAVLQHLQTFADITSERDALVAHVKALEHDLSMERAKTGVLQEAIKSHIHTIDWYSRTTATLLATYRGAAQMMHDGFNRALKEARDHQMVEGLQDALQEVAPTDGC